MAIRKWFISFSVEDRLFIIILFQPLTFKINRIHPNNNAAKFDEDIHKHLLAVQLLYS